jgi:hypothetical protein
MLVEQDAVRSLDDAMARSRCSWRSWADRARPLPRRADLQAALRKRRREETPWPAQVAVPGIQVNDAFGWMNRPKAAGVSPTRIGAPATALVASAIADTVLEP